MSGDINEPEAVSIPITDELDLHTFSPKDLKSLIPEYLEAAHAAGFRQVRIIHGKGIGTLRETVHSLLNRSPLVASFGLADSFSGSWGATRVRLRDKPD
jgi:DNA-nicking Smr family endonuclease